MTYKVYSDPYLDISSGKVAGHSVVNKFGANDDSAAGTREDIWDGGGDYIFPSGSADITRLVTSVDDPGLLGANIEIQGLDINYTLTVQTVALDGSDTTTPVPLDTNLIRVFRMKVLHGALNTEIVKVTNTAGSISYAEIHAGNNQTLMAIYTVPSGFTAYMPKYYASTIKTGVRDPDSTEYALWVRDIPNNYEFQLKHQLGIAQNGANIEHDFKPYFKVNEMHDIKMTSLCDTNAGHVHAGFDLILVDNDV